MPSPAPVPPPDYQRTTTYYGPDGVRTQHIERVRRRQIFYDGNGQLSAHTTTTRTHSVTYGPAPVYAPAPIAAVPAPAMDLPPNQYSTTTTTVTHEEE